MNTSTLPPVTDIDVNRLAFPAYRLFTDSGDRSLMFSNLALFFEAEKFRGVQPELFNQVLHSPSIKEARKLTKRHQALWREDWAGVRLRVLATGIQYMAWADTGSERWHDASPDNIAQHLAPLGLPSKFLLHAATEFVTLRDAPHYCFLMAPGTPDDVIGRKLNTLHRKYGRKWGIMHWDGRHGNRRVHDWALNQYLPIRYFGVLGERLHLPTLSKLLTQTNAKVCVFETRGGKNMDAVIQHLRPYRSQFELEFFQPSPQG